MLGIAALPSWVESDYGDGSALKHHEHFVDLLSRSGAPLLLLSIQRRYLFMAVAGISDFVYNLVVRALASFLPNLRSFISSARPDKNLETEDDASRIDHDELADALQFRWGKTDPSPRLKAFRMTISPKR
ncbi:hypothetical protein C8R45DRAFT_1090055 [Mycena sanguinolenta]|nr:hypothetical protein C8R45DRAFT_1090055 [Mycena sanguinolenta]